MKVDNVVFLLSADNRSLDTSSRDSESVDVDA